MRFAGECASPRGGEGDCNKMSICASPRMEDVGRAVRSGSFILRALRESVLVAGPRLILCNEGQLVAPGDSPSPISGMG